jgi:hypothetical protein
VRNVLLFVGLIGAAVLAVVVIVPILGILLIGVAVLLAVLLIAFLAAPLLAKLPWFRGRINVQRSGGRRIIRFGPDAFSRHRDHGPENDDDVIDVEGTERPDDKE